jgi:hypothetical protein
MNSNVEEATMWALAGKMELLLGDGWSWKAVISSLATQEGVVRLAIVVLALGLFIMLKK